MTSLTDALEQIRSGDNIDYDQALKLAIGNEPAALYKAADQLRKEMQGDHFDLCSIINARSGKCSENCKFCAQSSRYQTEIETYDFISYEEVRRQGLENESLGVARYSMVTAGREVSDKDIESFASMYGQLGHESDLYFCASMGFLTSNKANKLVAAGVKRYHCNLETCRSFFPRICTTHTWEEKVETIRIAREAGMDICSGGIIGLGESFGQRLELALELRELEVLSIPINILTPIPGTPLGEVERLSLGEVLTCIAMFRLINPRAVVRLAGGRAQLGDQQYRCFQSGANGAIVGNYLTTTGNSVIEDLQMIESLGFSTGGVDAKK
ncbi:MAG: biotin synthase BioB [Desulfobulbaceae bacterium]|nr:MAG: biotin synthase BioB [Desulfobulbaceae bacterium]